MSTDSQITQDIVLSESGQPFKSIAAAKSAMKTKGLDPKTNHVIPMGDGFAIAPGAGLDSEDGRGDGPMLPARPNGSAERFFEVEFAKVSSPTDPVDVTLAVNGEVLVIRRGQRITLPERFLEAADHATYKRYTVRPDQARKEDMEVMTFPYTRFREATRAEYEAQKRSGDEATQKDLKARGLA
ncbi:MAG: hypothetical protein ABFD89_01715 [Bryobacteraceae bacterium]